MKRDCRVYRDDTPSPVLPIVVISAFLGVLWGVFGYILGAVVGFPS